ncbi:uncharacterized protein LOC113351338 [Papaver somniferum]|uniref:uncharacterized protein LOC113351338 n=1 Tax=Papaver somniferum TaxID=3469 RepID=UPI000E6F4DEF|nr:uncharacterized protein LOC113351338 [Papaver somniferum]
MTASDQYCVLCYLDQTEDLDHLLLHCPFSQAIWREFFLHQFSSIMQHSTALSWVNTWQLSDSMFNIQKNPYFIHLVICIMHFIWKHRCRCVFDNTTPNFSSVIHQVRYYVAQHHLDSLSDAYNLTVRDSHILNMPWEPPPPYFLKINIDASYNNASLLVGIGIITRNSAGAYVMGRGTVRRAINAQQAEAWAMQMAMVNGWTYVIFGTDNLGISLSCNKAADALAKAARKLNLYGNLWFQSPDLLNPYIIYDVSNLVVI